MGSQGVKWVNVIDVWQCLIWIASPVSIDRTSFSFKCRTTRKGSDFFGAEGFVVLKPANFWKKHPKKIPVTKGCFGGRSLLRGIVSTIELQVRHGCLGQLGDLHFLSTLWKVAKSIFQAGYNPCAWTNRKRLSIAKHRGSSWMKVDYLYCLFDQDTGALVSSAERMFSRRWRCISCVLKIGETPSQVWFPCGVDTVDTAVTMVTTKWHSHVISAPHVLSPPDGWTAMCSVRTTIHCTLDLSAQHIPSLHCPPKNHWTSGNLDDSID